MVTLDGKLLFKILDLLNYSSSRQNWSFLIKYRKWFWKCISFPNETSAMHFEFQRVITWWIYVAVDHIVSVDLMVADCNTPLSMYGPKLTDQVFNMSGDFGQCSESFNFFGYLPRGCRINLSYTQNFFFGWFIPKDAVGGHMSRDTGIRKSEHPPPRSPDQVLPSQGSKWLSVRTLEQRCL